MSTAIVWSPQADATILTLRAHGMPWRAVAAQLSIGRNSVIERARRLGVRPITYIAPEPPRPELPRNDRPALPPGHPLTWKAITDNSPLQDAPYPVPVFL